MNTTVLIPCPHGDPTCPCQDGDPCHYEGDDAMACPRYVLAERPDGEMVTIYATDPLDAVPAGSPHCHVEGCGWRGHSICGLERMEAPERVALGLGCGKARRG